MTVRDRTGRVFRSFSEYREAYYPRPVRIGEHEGGIPLDVERGNPPTDWEKLPDQADAADVGNELDIQFAFRTPAPLPEKQL